MGYTDVLIGQPPKSSGFIDCKNKVGHLLAIFGCHSIEDQPDTFNQGQMRKVARIDYADLDDEVGGEIKWGALVDKPGIVNKLSVGMPTSILGRLIKGDAKAGQSAPFILDDHQPEDMVRFRDVWLPPNRAALAGTGPQSLRQAPAPQQQGYPAQATGTGGVAGVQTLQNAFPGAQQIQIPPSSTTNGPGTTMSAEAMAAFQQMVARGEIQIPTP